MKKAKINIEGLYQLKKQDLNKCAIVAAKAFLTDPACEFLFSSKLTYEALYEYFLVIFKALYSKMYIFADSENINGFIIITQIKNSKLSLYDFIKAGGTKVILSQGIGIILKSLNYESNCIEIRNKIAHENDWHIFQFGVSPEKQGSRVGSSIIKPVLKWVASQNVACYLETHKKVNVEIYKHLGFDLKSIDTLPNKKVEQYAMLKI